MLHLDVHLGEIIARYGRTTYAILFAIVFCETGLVVTPFLPGAPAVPGVHASACCPCLAQHQVFPTMPAKCWLGLHPLPAAPTAPPRRPMFGVRPRPPATATAAGDSLLFATGALAALGKLNVLALLGVYIVAATLGDAVNYASERTGRSGSGRQGWPRTGRGVPAC